MKGMQTISTIQRSRWLALASAGLLSLSIAACSSEQPIDSIGGESPENAIEGNAAADNAIEDDTGELSDPAVDEALDQDGPKDKRQPYGGPIVFTYLKDVDFIDFMVPHHRMGVEMDDIEIARGHRDEVKQLAKKDKEERLRQIAIMLAERVKIADNAKVPPPVADPKMERDMKVLRSLSGAKLDAFYLRQLLPNHAPTIAVAHRSMPTLRTKVIRTVAQEIFEKQGVEFAQVEVSRGKVQCSKDKDKDKVVSE